MNTTVSDETLFLMYVYSELEVLKDYELDRLKIHNECCPCNRCDIGRQWLELPWHRRFIAKLKV